MLSLKEYVEYVNNQSDINDFAPLSVETSDHHTPADETLLYGHIPQYDELLTKYSIPKLSETTTDFDTALAVMNWLTDNTYYCGLQEKILRDDALDILEFAVGNGFSHAINCRYKAIAMTDLLIAHNINAYPIYLVSGKAERVSCHFVVHVFLREENRWMVMDPSFNCYLANDSGRILDIFELRELYLSGKTPQPIGYSFNGIKECVDVYLKYFLGITLTNLTTWSDNSNDRRTETVIWNRKEFNSALPIDVSFAD